MYVMNRRRDFAWATNTQPTALSGERGPRQAMVESNDTTIAVARSPKEGDHLHCLFAGYCTLSSAYKTRPFIHSAALYLSGITTTGPK